MALASWASRTASSVRVPAELIGAQRTDPSADRHSPRCFLDGGLECPATLSAGEIGVRAGTAEQADGVDAFHAERGDEPAQGGNIDLTSRIGGRDGEGGKPFQKHEDHPSCSPAGGRYTHNRVQRRIGTTPPIRRATPTR